MPESDVDVAQAPKCVGDASGDTVFQLLMPDLMEVTCL